MTESKATHDLWHTHSEQELLQKVGSGEQGLETTEVRHRLAAAGPRGERLGVAPERFAGGLVDRPATGEPLRHSDVVRFSHLCGCG